MKSQLFKNSTEKVLLFNYLDPIFETLSKHWIPETTSNSSRIRCSTDTISVSDQKNIIPEINTAEQLSFYFDQHFNSQSNIPSDGLVVISDFWLNELPLECLITNTLLIELSSIDCQLYRRQSSLIRRGQTTAASNSSKQNHSPALKRINRVLPFSWLTRDFSVQLLYSRLTGHQNTQKSDDQSAENHEQSAQHKTARKTDVIRGSSRHPLLRDTGAKLPPLQSSKQQNSGCLVVNTTCMRYLVDPFLDTEIVGADITTSAPRETVIGNDDDGNNNAKFTGISLKNHLQLLLKEPSARSQQFTSRWIGLMGDWELGKVPTKEELIVFLNEGASGLISYSTESFLSYLPPSAFVNLSIPNCYFICHLDKIYTRSSRLRQMKLDAHKTIIEHELEQALSTAVTTTLTGSRSVITLQWPTSLKINQFRLEKLIGHLLDQAYTIGQSTLLIQYELFKKELDEYKVRLKQINEVKDIQMSKEKSLDEMNHLEGKYENIQTKMTPTLEPFNMIVYGLPNISFA
ncbi:unnamed protein product [Trichobilharzia szidati]|nr:unnamed protein product [Trichobilharzia szidati]